MVINSFEGPAVSRYIGFVFWWVSVNEKEAVREVIVILKRRLRKKLPRECWEKMLEEIDEIETVL